MPGATGVVADTENSLSYGLLQLHLHSVIYANENYC